MDRNKVCRYSVHLSIGPYKFNAVLGPGWISEPYSIRINVKMARRRTASCGEDNLFAFKLGTLKYFTKTTKEIAPAAAWTIPRAGAQHAEQTPPFITFYFKRGLGQIVRRVQLPFRHQGKKSAAEAQ